MVRRGCGLECKLTQARFRLKTLADIYNNIKRAFMKILAQNSQKTPLFFTISQKKNKYLAPRASTVTCARREVMLLDAIMLYGAYSTLDTLSSLYYLLLIIYIVFRCVCVVSDFFLAFQMLHTRNVETGTLLCWKY